ncbi:MAG: hypothetical protein CVV04_08470 [Firmicutes bacterium HGW-Firmicutes-9]|nr:MAG: hypothetical protein CVV04_08470 [Firmicutes bacterium HGW-Firmicutes-9]
MQPIPKNSFRYSRPSIVPAVYSGITSGVGSGVGVGIGVGSIVAVASGNASAMASVTADDRLHPASIDAMIINAIATARRRRSFLIQFSYPNHLIMCTARFHNFTRLNRFRLIPCSTKGGK